MERMTSPPSTRGARPFIALLILRQWGWEANRIFSRCGSSNGKLYRMDVVLGRPFIGCPSRIIEGHSK